RSTRRLLRLRRCRILAFTRNPFLLVVMMRCYFIQHRRNSKGFRVFQKNSKQKCDTFAWLRIRYGTEWHCSGTVPNTKSLRHILLSSLSVSTKPSLAWAYTERCRDFAFCEIPVDSAAMSLAGCPSLPTLQLHGAFLVWNLLIL